MRTSSSSAGTSARAVRRETCRCARMTSTIWLSMVETGFRAFIAPCITSDTPSQRYFRNPAPLSASTSCPRKLTVPPHRAERGSSRRMAWATVDLPLPDSPTRPSTSPRPILNQTSDTACTGPWADPNSTFRPATSSTVWSGCMGRLPAAGKPDDEGDPVPRGAEPGVGDLIDREVEHGGRGAGQGQAHAGRDELPPGALQQAGIALRPVQDRAPAHRRQVAEAEELQRGQ